MDRIDALLDIYLESGDFPADATEAECEEVAALAASAGMVRASAAAIDSEARASMPEARARFERFVVASRPSAPPVRVVQPRRGLFGLRLLTVPRMLGLATALAVLIIVAGLTGSRLTSGPETVEALEVGDYVEMPGVVTAAEGAGDDRVITVSGPLGDIVVEASTETSIVQSEASADIATLQPGAQVVVAGTVLASRRIAAQTVAVGDPSQPATEPLTLKRLRELKPNLAGTVVVLALSPDDARARVVLNVPGDRTYLVTIDAASARALLQLSRSLGAEVSIARKPGAAAGEFSLEVASPQPTGTVAVPPSAPATATRVPQSPSPAAERPSLVRVEGVVAAINARTVTLLTLDGRKSVVIRPEARILPGESGLTAGQLLSADALGHLVVVRGGIDVGTGAVIADIVLIGQKVERPLQNR
ncbi:MAG: hypothetical protein R3B97_17185 [Dehalococcoidia bacterium]|nr:hypothetical protein [Dehalococcoidia bacterium]